MYILNGNVFDFEVECVEYEVVIVVVGGIDFFFVGIGEDGYIVFNELGLSFVSWICVKMFVYDMILVNLCFFNNDVN